jgi:ABC-type transport system substrate-binding protein
LVSVLAPGVRDAIDLNEMYPYRPDEAKRLLKELGFDEKNPLRFTILIGNQDATIADVATLIKSQMAKIGVEAKINLLDQTATVDRVLVKHDFEMTVSNFATLRDIDPRVRADPGGFRRPHGYQPALGQLLPERPLGLWGAAG